MPKIAKKVSMPKIAKNWRKCCKKTVKIVAKKFQPKVAKTIVKQDQFANERKKSIFQAGWIGGLVGVKAVLKIASAIKM